jgi:ATP-binding cassette subfamily F protein uup
MTAAAGAPAPRRKLSYIDQREWDSIEARIAEAEASLTALRVEQDSPEVVTNHNRLVELETEIAAAQAAVDRLYARWAELESLIPRA